MVARRREAIYDLTVVEQIDDCDVFVHSLAKFWIDDLMSTQATEIYAIAAGVELLVQAERED